MSHIERQIFKSGSRTHYLSSLFFPRKIREDVFRLYSFVRIADDYVDEQPSKPEELRKLRDLWKRAQSDDTFDTATHIDDPINHRVIKNLMHVVRKYKIEPSWVDSFFDSMQLDINNTVYKTLEDLLHYTHGSAEVIGLMMARIMGLPEELDEAAMMQGRAMQYINFIRDINEDTKLKRQYFPSEDLMKYSLPNLQHASAQAHPEEFGAFVQFQLQRYIEWQYKAELVMNHIPRRRRIPLQTATAMYAWTAQQIKKDPFVIYRKKLKPSRWRVITTALSRTLRMV